MRQIITVATILLFPARFLIAQAPVAPATIMTMERLRVIGDSLMPGASRTAQLGRGSGYTYAMTHRDSSGTLEGHAVWTTNTSVQSACPSSVPELSRCVIA